MSLRSRKPIAYSPLASWIDSDFHSLEKKLFPNSLSHAHSSLSNNTYVDSKIEAGFWGWLFMGRLLLILVLVASSLPLTGIAEDKGETTPAVRNADVVIAAINSDVPAPPQQLPTQLIRPGDAFRVKLLAGVNAPTDGTPYPVILRVLANLSDPGGKPDPLGECRIVAAAQSSLADSRVVFRLTNLHCKMGQGKRRVLDIDGWIVGEDGIRGIKGEIIDPLGKTMAVNQAGSVNGIEKDRSEGTPSLSEESPIDCTDFSYASGKGNNGAACAEKIIRERAAHYVPQVQVLSGVEAIAVFSKAVELTELLEE